jgi:hypothetical protein
MRAARFLLLHNDLDDDARWLTSAVMFLASECLPGEIDGFGLLGRGIGAVARRPTRPPTHPQWSVELVLDDCPSDDLEMLGQEVPRRASAVGWD